jgi:CMP-N-acetylneuraminic acid synthetase
MRKISALILAKSDSRRLPKKNTLDFNGVPMFLVNVIKCVEIFDKTYVSSDDDDMKRRPKAME